MLFGNTGFVKPVNSGSEEISPFVESMVLEGALMELDEEEIEEALESATEMAALFEEVPVLEASRVILDKDAKLAQAEMMAVYALAKEDNDPKMKKLMTIWKWESYIEKYLKKKYGMKAKRVAKETIKNRKNTKSTTLGKAIKKTTKKSKDYSNVNAFKPNQSLVLK